MLKSGLIGPDCLVGSGRHARILVERAKAQISARRDPGQALGNGLGTRLAPEERVTRYASVDARIALVERLGLTDLLVPVETIGAVSGWLAEIEKRAIGKLPDYADEIAAAGQAADAESIRTALEGIAAAILEDIRQRIFGGEILEVISQVPNPPNPITHRHG